MSAKRILLAEDEAITAALMEKILKRNGYQMVGPCATGLDVVYATLAHKPDLVLMDIRLVGAMDGLEAAEVIRKDTQIPILFLTGYDTDEMRAQAAKIPGTAFMVKPPPVDALVAMIEKMCPVPVT